MVTQMGVNNSESFNFIAMFGDTVEIREWFT